MLVLVQVQVLVLVLVLVGPGPVAFLLPRASPVCPEPVPEPVGPSRRPWTRI
ncbi:hypothetical protein [Cryobacterium cheniae]|uniref:hypothetical protein n=1 Tax=Cryobacterium cheniae TaxID=1259262 RepID=UPI001F5414F2|nr:hypothetical protein [Cryobacterium cheniae]